MRGGSGCVTACCCPSRASPGLAPVSSHLGAPLSGSWLRGLGRSGRGRKEGGGVSVSVSLRPLRSQAAHGGTRVRVGFRSYFVGEKCGMLALSVGFFVQGFL